MTVKIRALFALCLKVKEVLKGTVLSGAADTLTVCVCVYVCACVCACVCVCVFCPLRSNLPADGNVIHLSDPAFKVCAAGDKGGCQMPDARTDPF